MNVGATEQEVLELIKDYWADVLEYAVVDSVFAALGIKE